MTAYRVHRSSSRAPTPCGGSSWGVLDHDPAGVHPTDVDAPLIRLWEGKGYDQVWVDQVMKYIGLDGT